MNAKELESLIKLLDDPDTEISSHVTEKIKEYGPEVIAYLEKAWEESLDAQLQERIENLVHQLQFEQVQAC